MEHWFSKTLFQPMDYSVVAGLACSSNSRAREIQKYPCRRFGTGFSNSVIDPTGLVEDPETDEAHLDVRARYCRTSG